MHNSHKIRAFRPQMAGPLPYPGPGAKDLPGARGAGRQKFSFAGPGKGYFCRVVALLGRAAVHTEKSGKSSGPASLFVLVHLGGQVYLAQLFGGGGRGGTAHQLIGVGHYLGGDLLGQLGVLP